MSDIVVKYKNNTIAEMTGSGTKTLKTTGKFCEEDITINYTAPAASPVETTNRTYEVTLAKASGWVLLTALDSDVLAHINDETFAVSLICCISEYEYVYYASCNAFASNRQIGLQGSYPVYGVLLRQTATTTTQGQQIYYKPNKTDTSTSLGGGAFRVTSGNYYFKPSDGYVRAGTYRLTFHW